MISKQEALAVVAEIQAEIASELGEPTVSPPQPVEAVEAPNGEPTVDDETASLVQELKVSVVNAERRATEAEARARAAEKAARIAKRSSGKRTGVTRFRPAKTNAGFVIVKIDGKDYSVKAGQTIEVTGGTIDKLGRTASGKRSADTSKYVR